METEKKSEKVEIYGICLQCKGECNFHSQLCPTCIRKIDFEPKKNKKFHCYTCGKDFNKSCYCIVQGNDDAKK